MTKLIIIGLIVLAAVVLAVWALILEGKRDLLNKRLAALENEKEQLAKQMDRLKADRETLDENMREIKRIVLPDDFITVSASYAVSESDQMRYSTDRAIEANAKNRIAMTIAHDIVKQFKVIESKTEDGRRRFTYKFKIKIAE